MFLSFGSFVRITQDREAKYAAMEKSGVPEYQIAQEKGNDERSDLTEKMVLLFLSVF